MWAGAPQRLHLGGFDQPFSIVVKKNCLPIKKVHGEIERKRGAVGPGRQGGAQSPRDVRVARKAHAVARDRVGAGAAGRPRFDSPSQYARSGEILSVEGQDRSLRVQPRNWRIHADRSLPWASVGLSTWACPSGRYQQPRAGMAPPPHLKIKVYSATSIAAGRTTVPSSPCVDATEEGWRPTAPGKRPVWQACLRRCRRSAQGEDSGELSQAPA